MPPAKKPASRAKKTTPPATTSASSISSATRQQLQRAVKRLEKSLDDAQEALQSLGKDVGHGGHRTYRDLGDVVKRLRGDAKKANSSLAKDLEKLRAAVTPSRARAARPSARRAAGSRTAAKKTPARRSTRRAS
jgi:hypothetical protein